MSSPDPMTLAISLALKGQGRTAPNPCVGAVILDRHTQEVVASGHHTRAGLAHAEVEAIRRIPKDRDPADLILYVTLEPCCVFGRTPPCTQAILAAGIRHVVVGTPDPDPRMQGRGIKMLRDAGVHVAPSEHRAACQAIIRPFAKRVLTGKPWVVAKWAMTLDGKIATHTGASRWITSAPARAQGHQLRDRCDAILVGSTTLLHDDPSLTCRLGGGGGRDPVRVVLDARLQAPLDAKVFRLDSAAPTVVITGPQASEAKRQALLGQAGVKVVQVGVDARGWLVMDEVLGALGTLGINSVLVEGGSQVLGSLHAAGQIDEVVGFVAPKVFGGQGAPSPVGGAGVELPDQALRLEEVEWRALGDGEMMCTGVVHREPEPRELWEV